MTQVEKISDDDGVDAIVPLEKVPYLFRNTYKLVHPCAKGRVFGSPDLDAVRIFHGVNNAVNSRYDWSPREGIAQELDDVVVVGNNDIKAPTVHDSEPRKKGKCAESLVANNPMTSQFLGNDSKVKAEALNMMSQSREL